MTISEILGLALIGLIAGVFGGTLGLGGGLIVIPSLVFFMGFSQHQAQGTNLAFMLAPIGILAVVNYYKSGYVNFKYAAVLAAFFVAGAYFGSKLAVYLPETILKKVFGVVLVLIGLKIFFGK